MDKKYWLRFGLTLGLMDILVYGIFIINDMYKIIPYQEYLSTYLFFRSINLPAELVLMFFFFTDSNPTSFLYVYILPILIFVAYFLWAFAAGSLIGHFYEKIKNIKRAEDKSIKSITLNASIISFALSLLFILCAIVWYFMYSLPTIFIVILGLTSLLLSSYALAKKGSYKTFAILAIIIDVIFIWKPILSLFIH